MYVNRDVEILLQNLKQQIKDREMGIKMIIRRRLHCENGKRKQKSKRGENEKRKEREKKEREERGGSQKMVK